MYYDDGTFMTQVAQTIELRLCEEGFGVAQLAEAVALSRVQLYRRVMRSTGVSPGVLIRRQRLARAARLLRHEQLTVTEAVFAVGFQNLSYFAKVFRQHFGVPPSGYA